MMEYNIILLVPEEVVNQKQSTILQQWQHW